jgi:hypothetical protein
MKNQKWVKSLTKVQGAKLLYVVRQALRHMALVDSAVPKLALSSDFDNNLHRAHWNPNMTASVLALRHGKSTCQQRSQSYIADSNVHNFDQVFAHTILLPIITPPSRTTFTDSQCPNLFTNHSARNFQFGAQHRCRPYPISPSRPSHQPISRLGHLFQLGGCQLFQGEQGVIYGSGPPFWMYLEMAREGDKEATG